jgi:hypothetical protein
MKVSLKSTGEMAGTTVQADGKDIHGVTAVRFRHEGGDLPRLEIDLCDAEISVDGRAIFCVYDPTYGLKRAVTKIVFADGSEWIAP